MKGPPRVQIHMVLLLFALSERISNLYMRDSCMKDNQRMYDYLKVHEEFEGKYLGDIVTEHYSETPIDEGTADNIPDIDEKETNLPPPNTIYRENKKGILPDNIEKQRNKQEIGTGGYRQGKDVIGVDCQRDTTIKKDDERLQPWDREVKQTTAENRTQLQPVDKEQITVIDNRRKRKY